MMNEICKECQNKDLCKYCGELAEHIRKAKEKERELKKTMDDSIAFSCKINVTCNYFKSSWGR